MKRTREKDALDRAADGMLWTDRLMELFWAVDETVKAKGGQRHLVPGKILDAYDAAERARREL